MTATIRRTTKETDIELALSLNDPDRSIDLPLKFLGHVLDGAATHGRLGLRLRATGDIDVDQHHLVEDVGIALGQATAQLFAGGAGRRRAGFWRMPMDESLAEVALDLSGRACFVGGYQLQDRMVGDLDAAALREFWLGFTREARCALHVDLVRSENDHHAVEAMFKAFGRALRMALSPVEADGPLSSKGSL